MEPGQGTDARRLDLFPFFFFFFFFFWSLANPSDDVHVDDDALDEVPLKKKEKSLSLRAPVKKSTLRRWRTMKKYKKKRNWKPVNVQFGTVHPAIPNGNSFFHPMYLKWTL